MSTEPPVPAATDRAYRGRIAPTPTGYLHLGHGRTFLAAYWRAQAAAGSVVLRIEDLDTGRCKPGFVQAIIQDLDWLGIHANAPAIHQRDRRDRYLEAWRRLRDRDAIYPCNRSRRDVRTATQAPHADDDAEPIFPTSWRPAPGAAASHEQPAGVNWRFRVPDGACIQFHDAVHGLVSFTAGVDFGDFVVWRRDDVPAYELSVVVDDAAQRISEVVRGDDLLLSTARQALLYQALHLPMPGMCHLPLVLDEKGKRLAKRHAPLAMRELRQRGLTPEQALAQIPAVPQKALAAPPIPARPSILPAVEAH